MALLAALLALPSLAPAPLSAQVTGRLEGRVFDEASGRSLAGARVTVRGPALPGQRTTETGADGRFAFAALPAGSYFVIVAAPGYGTLEQDAVTVLPGRFALVELAMLPGEPDEIVLTGPPSVLDRTRTPSGVSFLRPGFVALPFGRFASAPGFLAFDVAPGGLPGTPAIAGASPAGNRFHVDGLEVTDPTLAVSGADLPLGLLSHLELRSGGNEVWWAGSAGGTLDLVTRSGGGRLAGELGGSWSGDETVAEPPRAAVVPEASRWSVGGSVGGALAGDRLWGFGGWHRSDLALSEADAGLLRLTARPAEGHLVSATGFFLDVDGLEAGLTALPPGVGHDAGSSGAAAHAAPGETGGSVLRWDAALGEVELAAAAGVLERDRRLPLVRGSRGAGRGTGAEAVTVGSEARRWELSGRLGWLVESPDGNRHELVFGGLLQRTEERMDGVGPGVAPGPAPPLASPPEARADGIALFVEDRVRLGRRLVVALGLRAEMLELDAHGGATDGLSRSGLDFGADERVSPRVAALWDIAENGRSKLYGYFGRSYEPVPLAAMLRLAGAFAPPGAPAAPVRLPPEVEAPFVDEVQLGYEYEVVPNIWFTVRAAARQIDDVLEDFSPDGGRSFVLGNPGGALTANPATGEPLPALVTFAEPERDHESLEVTLNKRLRNGWQLFAGHLLASTDGNYEGLYAATAGELAPHATSQLDLPSLGSGAEGPLPTDRRRQTKVYGSYLFRNGLTAGVAAEWLDGTPISRLGAHPLYGRASRRVGRRGDAGRTPTLFHLDLHLDHPVALPSGLTLTLSADVFNLTNERAAIVVDQEWSLAEAAPVAGGRECGGADPHCVGRDGEPLGNPGFGRPLAFQDPRRVRVGVAVSF